MPKLDDPTATIRVFTFKEGLLSKMAHDLELDARAFSIEVSEEVDRLVVEVDAASLVVLHAMKDGRPAPSALSARDLAKIRETIADEVLHVARHPKIRFEAKITSRGDLPQLDGALELAGRTRPLRVELVEEGASWVARAVIHQPDFGVTPYSAMLGSLKIKPDVRVEARVARRAAPSPRAT